MTIDYRVGDVRARLAEIPDKSISGVFTSPPFVALRSYLPADHPDKHLEIGSEPDPASFIDTLLGLTAEWGRVLAPWGSIAIELGDTYAGSGGAGGDYNEGGLRVGQNAFDGSSRRERASSHKYAGEWANPGYGDGFKGGNPGGNGWPRAKCLALVPQVYAASLAYGRNLLTGAESPAGQWLVRNMIVWHRPNPAVGALGDKVRPSTSYIVVATRSPKRWFDLTAVRTPHARNYAGETPGGVTEFNRRLGVPFERTIVADPAGAPPLDCWFDEHDTWTITTQPSRLAHYAMWPPRLAERLVLMMCPQWVCRVCGEPRRRIEGKPEYASTNGGRVVNQWAHERVATGVNTWAVEGGNPGHAVKIPTTLGWTDCGHGDYTAGVVLDSFAGTGTTLCVADLHGRDAIGIDLDERNRDLLPRRMDECRKALFGVQPELPGQVSLFDGAAS